MIKNKKTLKKEDMIINIHNKYLYFNENSD
jgi:hypothetical protein